MAKGLKNSSKNCFISTKGGLGWEGRTVFKNGSKPYIKEACYRSLDRLKRDYVDLYYYHWPDKETPLSESLEALVELKNEGVILNWGLSNCDHIDLDHTLLDNFDEIYYQGHYNILHRDRLFSKKTRFKTIAYSPLEQGLLADSRFLFNSLSKKDIRNRNAYRLSTQHQYWLFTYFDLCEKNTLSPIDVSYAWLFKQSNVKGLVFGCRNTVQLKKILPLLRADPNTFSIPIEIEKHIARVPSSRYSYK